MRWWVLIFPLVAFAASPDFRVEARSVAGGAELVTVFGRLPAPETKRAVIPEVIEDVPLLSVLRDTLGDQDPANDRLRYLWVLTSADPSLLQRAAGALPFFYFHPDFSKNAIRRPDPVLDLADTSSGIWGRFAGSLTQVFALDPHGTLIRASTRRYRNNSLDQRSLRLLEGTAILSEAERFPQIETQLSGAELIEIQARLALAHQPLGGFVGFDKLSDAYFKQRTRTEEMRGHNWELLRQRAEANGLIFEPLGPRGSSTLALLWVAKQDLSRRAGEAGAVERKEWIEPSWDSQFIGIANPYTDERLKDWAGYTQTRYLDADGRVTDAGAPDARRVDLIPLALYGLEYPKVPLLLVDFRNMRAPKRREMVRRATTDVLGSVLEISTWGNWPYLAGAWTFNFVTARHGATNNRSARLKAYSQVRQWLALDWSLDPELRVQLQKRLEILGVNPLEDNVFDQPKIARLQYEALLRYAEDPRGLAARIENDRNKEATAYEHSVRARAGLRLASIASLGLYRHREGDASAVRARVDEQRRVARSIQLLEAVARGDAPSAALSNEDAVKQALDELQSETELPRPDDPTGHRVQVRYTQLLERVLRETHDQETRALLERALGGGGAAAGQ